ncbi:hypothetical protein Q5705_00510 [Kosakonia sp. H02]|nr:hypothetical protein Q5705_00510 [Kosakonia sp. H02]
MATFNFWDLKSQWAGSSDYLPTQLRVAALVGRVKRALHGPTERYDDDRGKDWVIVTTKTGS